MKKGLLFLTTALLLLFVGLRWNSAPFFTVKEYRCIQTGVLSDDYFSSITTSVGQLLGDNYSARTIIDQLKKQFPVLNKIVVSYHPSVVRVMVYAHEPVCYINNSLVLTTNNELFPKNSFSDTVIAAVPEIVVAQESMSKISPLVSSLLHELPIDFNQLYDLELVNEHCVYLTDKKEPHFTAVFCADQKKLSMILAQCTSVKKNIGERKGFDKGAAWIADTRFADYIVAYKT